MSTVSDTGGKEEYEKAGSEVSEECLQSDTKGREEEGDREAGAEVL